MYGYAYPRRPELGAIRVRVCESEINGYRRRYPQLSRARILDAMIDKGPWRASVEAELKRLAREPAPVEG
jgi:hypothetical protein